MCIRDVMSDNIKQARERKREREREREREEERKREREREEERKREREKEKRDIARERSFPESYESVVIPLTTLRAYTYMLYRSL